MDRSGTTTVSGGCASGSGTFYSSFDPSQASPNLGDIAELIYGFDPPAERSARDASEKRRVVVTDQTDKNFIADLLVLLVILIVVVGGFAVLHTTAILLGGGLALVVAVAAEFVWSR
jgi:hypothetical protein